MTAASATGASPSLAGLLRVRPGVAPPEGLLSSRQDWAARVAPGQPASALPGIMASLYNLCSHAHRLCCQLAIDAAAPGLQAPPTAVAQRLRAETAQEHLRRIALDWPRLLAADPSHGLLAQQALASLREGPGLGAAVDGRWGALSAWLEASWLQMPPRTWLRAWEACGADWLNDWSQRHTGWLSTLVREARPMDSGHPLDPASALQLQSDGPAMAAFASELAADPGLALRPTWRGDCAHTGSWTRLHGSATALPMTPWALLGSRIAELIRLSLDGAPGPVGNGWLCTGTLAVAPGQGLAWVEMARGVLIYQVELDAAGDAAAPRVRACQVVAPTEWNFHPCGAVAHEVAALDAGASDGEQERRVRLLMAAFDPCVSFEREAAVAASPNALVREAHDA